MTEEERFRVLLEAPRLAPAMRKLSQNMLALAASDRAIDGIIKDVGRFFAAGMAMALHATGGLTLPRLKDYCASTGVISPGRARAILLYLRFLKFVEPAEGGGRRRRYVPTARMQNAWGAIIRAGLDAVQVIEPSVARLSNRLADPAVLMDYVRIQSEMSPEMRDVENNALWRVFLNRHAGAQILHALMQGAGECEHYPPHGKIAFSLSKLARDFHVSRPHVARLLRAGEQEGLLELHDGNSLSFTEAGIRHATILLMVRLDNDLRAATALLDETAGRPLQKAGRAA